ncbi:LysR family transcriptional regulator (plasmid) [Rhizobium sp. WL3]|uniref:LysR family transcriptional regulator n=1 Tax=Rhizobium sp. WL3 TaxID=2603277 RepID=UPI0011C1D74B|nr:LysR family transcriptional regulator [Rhizobium sp. WL3]QEE43440.1 LysR family transcriptional regulator [Rhizobium sp. WL3]
MEFRQLRYFVTVAQQRNFTRAAEILNITQPPLSRQIQLLEEELGVALFHRASRPVRLTESGRLLYEQALQVLGRIDQMVAMTRRAGLNEKQVLSIGFVASILYAGLPTLIGRLRQSAPELDIQLVELLSIQQLPALKEGRIDLGFGRLRQTDPSIVSTVLHEERLVVAVPRSSGLAESAAPLFLAQLGDQRLIVYPKEPRPSYADQVLNMLLQSDVRVGEVHEVRELQTALGLVAAGAGICVIPASARQMRSDVHYRPLADAHATSPIILYCREGDTSPRLKLIQKMILDCPPGPFTSPEGETL